MFLETKEQSTLLTKYQLVKNDDQDKAPSGVISFFTSKMVGTTLKTIAERIKLMARLPRSIILFKPPVSRLGQKSNKVMMR